MQMARITAEIRELALGVYASESLGEKWRSGAYFSALQQSDLIDLKIEHVSLDSTIVKVHPDGTGALKKTVFNLSVNREAVGPPKFTWWRLMREQP